MGLRLLLNCVDQTQYRGLRFLPIEPRVCNLAAPGVQLVSQSTQRCRLRCQFSSDCFGYRSKNWSCSLTSGVTQLGLNFNIKCTEYGGFGSSLSIADAKG